MLLTSKQTSDPEEDQIFPARRDVLTAFPVVIFLINVAIGTGVVKLGPAYRAGAIFSPILSAIIALVSCYSFSLFLKAACWARASTFEEIWAKAFGPKTVPICATISMLSKLMALKAYTSFVIDSVTSLIRDFYPGAPVWLTDKYVIITLVFIVFYIPTFSSKSLKLIAAISYIKVFCLAFLCCVILYRFADQTMKNGFDPNHQMSYFRFDRTAVSCLDSLLTAYLVLPLCYPGIRHVSHFTVKSFLRLIRLTMLICWIVYNIVGEICYFTVWNENMGSTILDYYPDDILNTISRFALTIMMIYTCPVALNPVRFVMINLIAKGKEFPTVIWGITGVLVSYIAVVLTSLTGDVNFYVTLVTNIRSPFILFIFPAILYLKAFGRQKMFHFIGSIVILLLGLAATGFVLWLPFDTR